MFKYTSYFEKDVLAKRPYIKKEWCERVVSSSGYSDEIGRSFRFKSATCSDSNRPAVLMQIGHPVGAKRRWFLVLSHNNVIKSSRNVFFS